MKTLVLMLAMLAVPLAAGAAHADVPPTVGTSACGGTAPAHIVPLMETHTVPPYPPESVQANEQGISVLRVAIAPSGVVVDDSLVQSSGSERLDAAALDFVKKSWRWQPMPGCRTPVSVAVSINWQLRDRPGPPIARAMVMKMLRFIAAPSDAYPPEVPKTKTVVLLMGLVSESGAWQWVAPFQYGNPALAEKSKALAATHRWTPALVDGKPVATLNMIGVIWTPPGETPVDPDQVPKVMEMFMPSAPGPSP